MKLRLTYWSRSLVAVVALTGQATDALELRTGPGASPGVVFDSPLTISRWLVAEDLFATNPQLPDSLNASATVAELNLPQASVEICPAISFTTPVTNSYHSRAPPYTA